jgi:2-dehydro-3-deoxyglucarate aldolase
MKYDMPPLVGSWLSTASPIAAELMAESGLDFVCVDAEHSAVDLGTTQSLFQAIKAGDRSCRPFVRLPGGGYSDPKRYVDAGAAGIIAPLVNSKEEAEELVRSVKYPPLGERGVGFCRANAYGRDVLEHFETANDEVSLIVQIEHIDAVECVDRILSVDGVDGAFIGPFDLSASMGLTAQFENQDFIDARDRVLESCKRHDCAAGIHVVAPEPDEVLQRVSEGYRLIAYTLDITALWKVYSEGLNSIRSGLKNL